MTIRAQEEEQTHILFHGDFSRCLLAIECCRGERARLADAVVPLVDVIGTHRPRTRATITTIRAVVWVQGHCRFEMACVCFWRNGWDYSREIEGKKDGSASDILCGER